MGRGNAYAAVGSKLNMGSKMNSGGQQHVNFSNNDQSLSNGYLVSNGGGNGSHGSPKFNSKSKYFSNQPLINMKFPTTSHGNRSQTNHAGHNYSNMQNVLGNI